MTSSAPAFAQTGGSPRETGDVGAGKLGQLDREAPDAAAPVEAERLDLDERLVAVRVRIGHVRQFGVWRGCAGDECAHAWKSRRKETSRPGSGPIHRSTTIRGGPER